MAERDARVVYRRNTENIGLSPIGTCSLLWVRPAVQLGRRGRLLGELVELLAP